MEQADYEHLEYLAHKLDRLFMAGYKRWAAIATLARVVLNQQNQIENLTEELSDHRERLKKLEGQPRRRRLY